MQFVLILILGFITGVFSGLFGVGGGTLMVPIFKYFFKMSMQKAIGTSLAVMVLISLMGSYRHFLSGNVEMKHVLFFALLAIAGGWCGALLASGLPEIVLRRSFAVIMIIIAISMFAKG